MKVEISNGEVLDKITILRIKKVNISDNNKLVNVERELAVLEDCASSILQQEEIQPLCKELLYVNQTLWNIEDEIREKERLKEFDEKFIELARSVYVTNDRRAEIKKQINLITNSELIEEKSYEQY